MASDVKWIKITTDMFDDEKIDFITSLPEADAIIVIWIRLLSLAGKCNAGGYIYLTERIPYTEDMLSHKFRKPITIIKLALETFQRLGMIEYDENIILITNWGKHQNIEGMEKLKERDRDRKRIERANKKLSLIGDVSKDSPRTVQEKSVENPLLEIELDRKLDIDKDIKPSLSKNKFSDDAIELSLACELYNLILLNNPNAKKPNLQAWAKSIDLMIRRDNRGAVEIQEVIRWCQQDSFWMGNILSTSTLREKFDQLTMKMKSVKRADKPESRWKQTGTSVQDDVTAQWLAMHEEVDNGQA